MEHKPAEAAATDWEKGARGKRGGAGMLFLETVIDIRLVLYALSLRLWRYFRGGGGEGVSERGLGSKGVHVYDPGFCPLPAVPSHLPLPLPSVLIMSRLLMLARP